MKSSGLLSNDKRFEGLMWAEPGPPYGFMLESREAITYKDLRTLLSGKDFEAYKVYKEKILQDGLPRLLDGEDLGHQKVAILGD